MEKYEANNVLFTWVYCNLVRFNEKFVIKGSGSPLWISKFFFLIYDIRYVACDKIL